MYFSFSPSPSRSSYTTAPIDLPSSNSRPQSPSCAFPSWPRRSSLSSNSSSDDNPSSFISDDDLELFPSVFDDADADCTPIATPYTTRSPGEASDAPHYTVVDTAALMRELVREEKAKKEKEKKRRSRAASGRKSSRSSSSGKHMSPIIEAPE
jgi:hypothetical protein